MRFAIVLVLGLVVVRQTAPTVAPAPPSSNAIIVTRWAETLGDELWKLTSKLTNIDEIKRGYNELHINVRAKNETSILNSAVESVGNMLQSKIDAVKCIHHKAITLASQFEMSEELAENFTYCSSKYSFMEKEDSNETLEGVDERPKFVKTEDIMRHYDNISTNEDSHFYHISVNTDRSCVQVPTNIYDQEADALEAILWSKELDKTFTQNYESDPSLVWQYFGSSAGILRLFPGMPWNKQEVDVFDCRVRSWYIEAATCSKDVIILFDVSGSMTGFRNYVARKTLKTLLETLSNNDFINVYTFKNETKKAIACFTDLVQATPENLKTITDELEPTNNGKTHKVPLEGYANLTTAYITAFDILKKRREKCNTTQETQGCNQLVMLITDYVPGNLTEVFEKYNREPVPGGNETRTPVRVFTYLIGKEVTNVREIQWMACLNRGYYVHIHSIEEVQQQVLKYINVIARPMILEGKEPPPTWTHAYIDETRTNKWGVSYEPNLTDADKLVTSVAIPAFKNVRNGSNKTTAELLGVAGTDVPIDSIAKLTQPHQLGVNGYAFIVSNNGYLLLHPYLVPSIKGKMQENLNSVDIVEVEQVDDGKGARELGDEISRLRREMVNGENKQLKNVPVLFHYDKMRRIAKAKHHYFYNKLEGTPFSLGISLPVGYGNTYLDVGDIWEVDYGYYKEVNITYYFNSSFRVHPDWVYCKYHYLEYHEKINVEMEVWEFLKKMTEGNWKWNTQYSGNITTRSKPFSEQSHCTKRAKLDKDDYYCNQDLMQMLVFDGKLTDKFYKEWTGSEQDLDLARLYNAHLRFISTSSGLTRWHYLFEDGMNEIVNEDGTRQTKDPQFEETETFGKIYPRSIEETWYMSAVLQRVNKDETLVVAVNFTYDDDAPVNVTEPNSDGTTEVPTTTSTTARPRPQSNITVTASYAIFARATSEDSINESPASVVGVQFEYANWRERFTEVTEKAHLRCDHCVTSCRSQVGVDCFLVDSSGYVVLAEEQEEVGKFFGDRHPRIMVSMVRHDVFEEKVVFDYQARCGFEDMKRANESSGAACGLRTPFHTAGFIIKWLIAQLLWMINKVVAVSDTYFDYDEIINQFILTTTTTTPAPPAAGDTDDDDDSKEQFSCDKEVHLYILQPERMRDGVYEKTHFGNCTPLYTAVMVKHTNLLLVVVDSRGWKPLPECYPEPISTRPTPTYESTKSKIPCHKLALGELERRRLEGCYTFHKKEAEIDDCGAASLLRADAVPVLAAAAVVLLAAPRRLLPP